MMTEKTGQTAGSRLIYDFCGQCRLWTLVVVGVGLCGYCRVHPQVPHQEETGR